jgi:hypothetical protein
LPQNLISNIKKIMLSLSLRWNILKNCINKKRFSLIQNNIFTIRIIVHNILKIIILKYHSQSISNVRLYPKKIIFHIITAHSNFQKKYNFHYIAVIFIIRLALFDSEILKVNILKTLERSVSVIFSKFRSSRL